MCINCNSITTNVFKDNAKYDPTRTTTLRNAFAKNMNSRFNKLEHAIYQKVVTEDCFGLSVTTNAYTFPTSAAKVQAFMEWLKARTESGMLSIKEYEQLGSAINNAWTNVYITDSYKRGVIRARYELQKAGFTVPSMEATGGILMSMTIPLHADRLGLLYTRVYTDLKGITTAMDTQIARILTQGMADGDSPLFLARKMLGAINGTGMGDLSLTDTLGRFIPAKRRAEMLARTEIIRAHHQATIQEYMNWGLENIIVQAEFITAGDDRVCSKCESMEGQIYSLEEAMNLVPVHPLCRCMCLPYEVGVDTIIHPKK
jgi:SPP1 gp7 family putative phage head morphogenesis protein